MTTERRGSTTQRETQVPRSALYGAGELEALDADLLACLSGLSLDAADAFRGRHDANMLSLVRAAASVRTYVGVMGGHRFQPTSPEFSLVLKLGAQLRGAGFAVATGGGPGAMSAANQGAARAHAGVLDLRAPWNLGVSTLAYTQEPPNRHAHGQARFFSKELRDAALAEACGGGLVFASGSAGTFQELFTHLCHNHYCAAHERRPLVLLGAAFWQSTGLLEGLHRLVATRPAAHLLYVADEVSEVVQYFSEHRAGRRGVYDG